MIKIAWIIIFIMLILATISAPSDDLLPRLKPHRVLRLKTIFNQINGIINSNANLDLDQVMEYDIIADFFQKYLPHDKERTFTWINVFFEQHFADFRRDWIRQMYLKLMVELNFNMNDKILIQQALKHPKKFSLDYSTYKVLIKPLE